MNDFEKLGVFYLGREYDLGSKSGTDRPLLYDSRDLVTHAVCVGMTGSGKTGLCVSLLEEAAIDGIPAIVVDPKGDLANLLLAFPDLAPEDFLPWINIDDARKDQLSPQEYAARQAGLWKKGLAAWGQDGARIARMRDAADFAIYTPGSTAGRPVSILKSFDAPPPEILRDPDALREKVAATVTSLLGLLGIDADPVQSREHIMLSTLMNTRWGRGEGLDLGTLIAAVQKPGIDRIGFIDLESFFPEKERFALAMKLNNLAAAPGFQAWLEGEPLDIGSILYTNTGKPRIAIFSIAHLGDAERMFFVSLLLGQVLGWMRAQQGTTSLRAILYMDEIFGYLPPVANPPSKIPLLTLLKQARAFGLGVVLATQNPVDLDYKGLSNTGTWFIGRLQTERDKQRVLEGLEGAAAGAAGRFDRAAMESILAGLGKRVFLMNNINEDQPVVFQTRWALSYLRGPLTKDQIRTLTASAESPEPAAPQEPAPAMAPLSVPAAPKKGRAALMRKPALPPGVPEYFLPLRGHADPGRETLYQPMLFGNARVYFVNARAGLSADEDVSVLAALPQGAGGPRWERGQETAFFATDLDRRPDGDAVAFGTLPRSAADPRSYRDWEKGFRDFLYRERRLTLLRSPSLKLVSRPGEAEREFRLRLDVLARESRDTAVERLRRKYASRIATLGDRIRRAAQAVEREREQARQQKVSTAISVGATIFGALLGRKAFSRSTVGGVSTSARRAGRMAKEAKDVKRATETLEALQRQLSDLELRLQEEIDAAVARMDSRTEELETLEVSPRKSDIAVTAVALVWAPFQKDESGALSPAF